MHRSDSTALQKYVWVLQRRAIADFVPRVTEQRSVPRPGHCLWSQDWPYLAGSELRERVTQKQVAAAAPHVAQASP